MTLSTATIVILVANTFTTIIAATLLILVWWQAPQRRYNLLFGFSMLTLGLYTAINGFARFIDELGLNPDHTFYLAISVYAFFSISIFFFAADFAEHRNRTMRIMRVAGVGLIVSQNVLLWTGNLMINIRPATSGDGSYTSDWSALGWVTILLLTGYMAVAAVVLYRMDDERAHSLWPAPVFVIAQVLSSAFIWPLVPIPLPSLFMAAAAIAMGLPVLRHQLFNPMLQLNAELSEKRTRLEEANQHKSQFLSNMSHELRTPLNSIIGYTELLTSNIYGELNETQRDRLEKVIRNGYHLLGLVNDVLDLNRIETGNITLDRKPIETVELLNSVLATIEPMATNKGLVIRRDYASAPALEGDERRLQQIVTNIIANAIKFTHEGSVTVRAFGDGPLVRLEIIDTGIGIPADQYEAVFAEFQQLDASATREYGGSGLGMAITKRLVELHGGQIGLHSTVGKGTTFFVTLPGAEEHVESLTPASLQPTPAIQTVLVIDDSADAREMLTDTLSAAGYQVLTAPTGPEGLAQAKQLQPDLITLDVMMPSMDGWQVLSALKESSETHDIPVVIVSIIDNRPMAISLGAHEALTKPLNRDHLLQILSQTLECPPSATPILVVDNEAEDRKLLSALLERKGYTVTTAEGGPEALEWLAENTPSLVLLDLMMPEVSGFDVLAQMRVDARLAQVPVVVITAKVLTQQEQAFIEQQYAALVEKGFGGANVLLNAIEGALVGGPATEP